MATPEELNNFIKQQLNVKKENALLNTKSQILIDSNLQQIKILESLNKCYSDSNLMRKEEDVNIVNSIALYKKMIRNGDYGDEFKDMEFVDEIKTK